MKKLLLIAAVCISSLSFGQSNSKMDSYLALKLENYSANKADAGLMLPMLIQGYIAGIKQLVTSNGGVFKYYYGNIASIIIPVKALETFNESKFVKRMDGAPPNNRLLDDSSNVKNRIIEVLNDLSPLPVMDFNGKGVVIGFVDTGIDFKHDDFRDSSGTRVQFYWDMNQPIGIFTPLTTYGGYGQAWTKKEIDLGLASNSAACLDFGHGSNVAGAAVGNAKCNGKEMGGCPKADIIMVAYNFSVQTATMFTDAMQYIYACADSLHEPLVINASMGSYDGSHDDSDLQGQMIEAMQAAHQPGSVFVASAGNAGVPYHVHDSLTGTTDTTFTWFNYDAGSGCMNVDIPIFANQKDFNSVKFRLRVDKVQPGSFIERDTMTVYTDISKEIGIHVTSVYNKFGNRLGVVTATGGLWANGSYSLEFVIDPDSTTYKWGFEATGTGRYDIWDYCSTNDVQNISALGISPITYPEIKLYKEPDTLMTICSSYQCSPNVITVQTYFNRDSFATCIHTTNINGNPADKPGAFNWGTSRGPTRNFVYSKPDVSAAGNFTLSALPKCDSVCNAGTDANGCHNTDGGTSMASPMVASAAGLYFQLHPHATNADIIRCIDQTTYSDKFTGTVSYVHPNYNWGCGKLDAFAALTKCEPSGIPMVTPTNTFKLMAYPNPYTLNTTINYDFSTINQFNQASIVVYDMMGKAVKIINLKGSEGNITLDRTNLASGVYFYSLVVDGARLKTEKLEVL